MGQRTRIKSPEIAVRKGIALLPEDRHREGLFMLLPVRENVVLPSLQTQWLNSRRMDTLAQHFVNQLRIRIPSLQAPAMQLSGGNQQKVVLAKWLASRSKVFIFDEPTQGIDVGSKVEIYRLIAELAQAGAGILLISSELREILSLSHRVLVMWKGRLVGNLARQEATPERVLARIFGDTAAQA
jgi:ribose transport system ATP-binding protein